MGLGILGVPHRSVWVPHGAEMGTASGDFGMMMDSFCGTQAEQNKA